MSCSLSSSSFEKLWQTETHCFDEYDKAIVEYEEIRRTYRREYVQAINLLTNHIERDCNAR